MQSWEIGLIVGCAVVSTILFAVVIRYLCCGNTGSVQETKPLLANDRQSTTTAALRIESHIAIDPSPAMADGAFLDAAGMKRLVVWIDDVERARRSEGLQPLAPSSAAEQSQLLGDTPEFSGVITPRTPNSLSPRMSGVDPVGGVSSTSGMYLGYSPKMVNPT